MQCFKLLQAEVVLATGARSSVNCPQVRGRPPGQRTAGMGHRIITQQLLSDAQIIKTLFALTLNTIYSYLIGY